MSLPRICKIRGRNTFFYFLHIYLSRQIHRIIRNSHPVQRIHFPMLAGENDHLRQILLCQPCQSPRKSSVIIKHEAVIKEYRNTAFRKKETDHRHAERQIQLHYQRPPARIFRRSVPTSSGKPPDSAPVRNRNGFLRTNPG